MKWLLNFLENKDRLDNISDKYSNVVYMKRYYLLFKEKKSTWFKKNFPFNLFIHHIMLSETDALHDHPWWYITIILKGGYWETTPNGTKWKGAGSVVIRRATIPHRLEVKPEGAWTLFLHGKPKREWGFIKDGKWIMWKEYPYSRVKV